MARTYFSMLGTNDYLPCNYRQAGSETVSNVRFVQEATIRWFCSDWDENDRILILTTDESRRMNWQDNGHLDPKTGKALEREGLHTRLKSLNLAPEITEVPVPVGKSEEEIWDIFEIVLEHLGHEDRVVMDITHAFRSLPLLAMVALNYAKVLKGITVSSISYGAMESLGSITDVRKMPLEDRNVPVFDLTAFDSLLDWTTAIDRFTGAGDARPLAALARRQMVPVIRKDGEQKEAAIAVRQLSEKLRDFTLTLSTCRGPEIGRQAGFVKDNLDRCKGIGLIKPLTPLMERLEGVISRFSGDTLEIGIEAARWCQARNMIQQGLTILQESVITHMLEQAGVDPLYKPNRDAVNPAMMIVAKKIPRKDWNKAALRKSDLTEKLIRRFNREKNLVKTMDRLTDLRNDINHAGNRDKKHRKSPEDLAGKLEKLLGELTNIC